MLRRYKVLFKQGSLSWSAKAPDVFDSYGRTKEDVIEDYCCKKHVLRSEIQDIVPLLVSRDGPGHNGEGYYVRDSYNDRPASAFKVHTVHPKKLVGTLWRDGNNRYLDYMLKITEVRPAYGTNPLNPFDLSQWEVEYVKVNPRTMQVEKGDFFGIIDPTYKRMNLAELMQKCYCDKMP